MSTMSAAKSARLLWSFGSCLLLPLLLLLSTSSLLANGEFYSSVDSLERLDSIESSLLLSFRKYSEALQDDLNTMRRFMERIKFQHNKAEENVGDYLGNPINAFTLIERVVRDWSSVDDLLKFEETTEELMNSLTQLKENSTLPDESELKGAIMGLARLQDIYDVKAEDMANGKDYGLPLTWRECYEIATTYVDELRADLAVSWLEETFTKLQTSHESKEIKEYFTIQIKENLALVHPTMGNHDNALEHLDDILADDHLHPTRLTKKLLRRLTHEAADYKPKKESDWAPNYAQLCQGVLTANETQQLSCHLDSSSHPFFILAPLQVEPIHLDPSITLYHNVLNDEQIAKLIQQTEGTLKRSKVIKPEGKDGPSEHRVSQQTWVNPRTCPTAGMIYRLLGHISGFNMTNAEIMQVANYGIGGHYLPHWDFFNMTTSRVPGLVGDRIATSMIYLSDVTQGGYTIFPNLNVHLKPVKGAMVMWYNLHKSLVPDRRTLHSGCPVLKGSKRIANIWTHAGFQDIARHCALENDKV